MLDFYQIATKRKKESANWTGRPAKDSSEYILVYPIFLNFPRTDIMTRGKGFYAIWNPETNLWSTDLEMVIQLIDKDLYSYADKLSKTETVDIRVATMTNDDSGMWRKFVQYLKNLPDSYVDLDEQIVFANTETTKNDYISRRLPYALKAGPTPAFEELFTVLYDDENFTKIKWAIGSVLTGESKHIQKFYAFYGAPGSGKSTVLNLIEKLCAGYTTNVTVGDLARYSNDFALEDLKDNPLVGIDHEGDLSRLESNSVLNSVVSHDMLTINQKYRAKFQIRLNTAIFMATNKPIRISDTKSGLTRRLIDIQPTGMLFPERKYEQLVEKLDFELGAIAESCIDTFRQLGPRYYSDYKPREMMAQTNHLFDFVQENSFIFERKDFIKRSDAWKMYQAYCEASGIQYPLPRYVFKYQFADYWDELKTNVRIDGKQTREVYFGFKKDVFQQKYAEMVSDREDWLSLGEKPSIFDRVFWDCPAQYVTPAGGLPHKWDNNHTVLKDLDTSKVHMMRPPANLVMIDFDIKDERGEKSLDLNLEAAMTWPPTYAETSKSGAGLHLYYYYEGDITQLSRHYAKDIEIRPPVGKTALRRKLTICNDHEITTINSGLPLRPEGEQMISRKIISNDRAMRTLILRNLAKEIHPHTKPSIDFIYAILEEGYEQGLEYDFTDLKEAVMRFAANSSNNREYCIDLVSKMKFKSDGEDDDVAPERSGDEPAIVFFDVEVFPNLFIVAWKFEDDDTVVRWYNPSRAEIASLLDYRLIGFNNRRYDNHILYGWLSGDTNEELYFRSSGIIQNDRASYFAKAYNLSYADVYNYSSVKQSLKKWEIDLGIPFDELDWDWDEPLPQDLWERAGEYCENDVRATEVVHKSRHADFTARKILAALSGLRINESTRAHVQRIIFGDNKTPQSEFNIPDLSKEFPGYEFDPYGQLISVDLSEEFPDDNIKPYSAAKGKSLYRGEIVGEGGYVWAEPGIYQNVVYLDIASMHPTSLIQMNLFGKYTQRFADLKEARILIKEGKLDEASKMFDGKLAPYLKDESEAFALAYALKIALNSVYGYTSTQKYDWAFRHPDNVDNVVAKRGALFMVDLKNALLERGCRPVHFKTDSVKIADYTQEDVEFVYEFGKRYGYDFGIEGIFERMALINDAVLIGKWKDSGIWEAVGARFAHPYVFKTLFSHEEIVFDDMVESRTVSDGAAIFVKNDSGKTFVGRVGLFCPVVSGGGDLVRIKGDRETSLPGTVGYKWLPAHTVRELGLEDTIDKTYFDRLVIESIDEIAKFGDPEIFIEGE